MYKIAFLTLDWNYEFLSSQIYGMKRCVDEHDDLQLFVFNAQANYLDEQIEKNSLEIFHMSDFSEYDGVIIQGNRYWPYEERQKIVDVLHKKEIPVVSVNYPLKGTVFIGTDNYKAIREMTEHVIKVHHARSLGFVAGLSSSAEAQERQRGFTDACRLMHIDDYRFYGESQWETSNGVRAADEMLQDPKGRVDALICANDNNARGAVQELLHHGLHVPEDILVTGFDHQIYANGEHGMQLTTVDRDNEQIGYDAVSVMIKLIHKEIHTDHVYSPYRIIYGESCGCRKAQPDHQIIKKYFALSRSVQNFYRMNSHYVPGLFTSSDVNALMHTIENMAPELNVRNAYLCIDDGYYRNVYHPEKVTHYSSETRLMSVYELGHTSIRPDADHVYARYQTREILPEKIRNRNHFYIIFPLHLNDMVMGFYVTAGIPIIMEYGFMPVFLTLAENAIENLRKQLVLNRMNHRLDDLYVHDQLSGLYNRFGFEKYGQRIYEKMLRENGSVCVSFVDIDNMKHINDVWGHEAGDKAIRTSAAIIKAVCADSESFAMRYGGDEFVILSGSSLKKQVEEKIRQIKAEYPYSLSVGETIVHPSSKMTYQDAFDAADQAMYQIKGRKPHHSGKS